LFVLLLLLELRHVRGGGDNTGLLGGEVLIDLLLGDGVVLDELPVAPLAVVSARRRLAFDWLSVARAWISC